MKSRKERLENKKQQLLSENIKSVKKATTYIGTTVLMGTAGLVLSKVKAQADTVQIDQNTSSNNNNENTSANSNNINDQIKFRRKLRKLRHKLKLHLLSKNKVKLLQLVKRYLVLPLHQQSMSHALTQGMYKHF